MEITILYDNSTFTEQTIGDWDFLCFIEGKGLPRITFDTGASGSDLLHKRKII